jgi:hypothetical protein
MPILCNIGNFEYPVWRRGKVLWSVPTADMFVMVELEDGRLWTVHRSYLKEAL